MGERNRGGGQGKMKGKIGIGLVVSFQDSNEMD